MTTDRLLRRALYGDATSDATPECVDPETLAAWMDGSLSGDRLAGAERHASSCARCQAMLASMARTAPSVEPRPWWQMLTARWLVPFAAAATALVLWVAVDRERAAPPAAVRPPQVERMEAPNPAAATGRDPGAASYPALERPNIGDDRLDSRLEPRLPSAAQEPQPTPFRDRRTAAMKSEKPDAAVPDSQALDRRAASPDRTALLSAPAPAAPSFAPQGALGAAGTPRAGSTSPPAEPVAAPPPPPQAVGPPPSTAQPFVAEPAPKAVTETVTLAETVTVTSESARVASQRAAGGRAAQEPVEIVSPEPAFRWRLVRPATIQRSTDGGATWTSQSSRTAGLSFLGGTQKTTGPTLTSLMLNAGSAPARDICWIVGSEGIVLLSPDGMSWQRRPFTEPVNLTAVRAIDAKAAVVTTEDGRQFSTADGGATWSKIP